MASRIFLATLVLGALACGDDTTESKGDGGGGSSPSSAEATTSTSGPGPSSSSSTTTTGAGPGSGGGETSAATGGSGPGAGGATGAGGGGTGSGSGGGGTGGGAEAALASCEDLNATVLALSEELGCSDPDMFNCELVSRDAADAGCPDLAVAFFDCLRAAYESASGCSCSASGDVVCDLPPETCAAEGEALLGEQGCLPPKT